MRKLTLLGNLGRDATLHENGTNCALNFSVATKERQKEGTEWVDITCWHNCTYWGKSAYLTSLLKHLKKGVKVYCEGSIIVGIYKEKPSIDVQCTSLVLCSSVPTENN